MEAVEKRANTMNRVILSLFLAIGLSQLQAQSYNILYAFPSDTGNGYSPATGMILASNVLFGTTLYGGTGGGGTLFSINTDGSAYSVLKNFTNTDGAYPEAGLLCAGGILYGTTAIGGDDGNGVIFQVNLDGSGYSVLRSFTATVPVDQGTNDDGAQPRGDLVTDGSALYGTTFLGGTGGVGTVFKINTDGSDFTVLKNFSALVNLTNSDGANPIAGLVLAGNTLYGTTVYGGVSSNGVVFQIQTDGTGFTVLKYFSGFTNSPGISPGTNDDGANPRAGLALDGGCLYGVAVNGGAFGDGVLYRLTTNGTAFSVLKNFSGGDGAQPDNRLLVNGNMLYGAALGGVSNNGVVFMTDTNGTDYSVLKCLDPADGYYSYSALVLTNNELFGTTFFGGAKRGGVVFGLTIVPQVLPPPQILFDGNFGIQSNVFGFDVLGASNEIAVLEACSDLSTAVWLPIQTNTLDGNPDYFSDPGWTNFPARFYRVEGE